MTRRKKILDIFFGLSLLTALFISGIKSRKWVNERPIESQKVIIRENAFSQALTSEEILLSMDKNLDCCLEKKRGEINTSMLEENIHSNPLVARSEVFSSLKGNLYVDVTPKVPIARIFDNASSFYWDAQGDPIPLSKHFAPSVPMLSGTIDSWEKEEVLNLLNIVQKNTFLAREIAGIHFSDQGEAVLIPIHESFRVVLGTPQAMEEKIRKLVVFWSSQWSSPSDKELKTIDIRFNRQIVCQYK